MTRQIISLLFVSMLTGCASSKDAIWMFFVSPWPDTVCETTLAHNFVGAMEPINNTPVDWSYSDSQTASDGIVFGLRLVLRRIEGATSVFLDDPIPKCFLAFALTEVGERGDQVRRLGTLPCGDALHALTD